MIIFVTLVLGSHAQSAESEGCTFTGTLRSHDRVRVLHQTAARVGDEFVFGFAESANYFGMLSVDLEGHVVNRKSKYYRTWENVPTVHVSWRDGHDESLDIPAEEKIELWNSATTSSWSGQKFDLFNLTMSEECPYAKTESQYKLNTEWTGTFMQHLCSTKTGGAVSQDGNTVAISTSGVAHYGRGKEQIQVFRRASQNDPWVQMGSQTLTAYPHGYAGSVPPSIVPVKDFGAGMEYAAWGKSIAMSADGETIVVGADAGYRGMVQVFQWSNEDWILKGQSIHHGQTDRKYTSFGSHVAISGDGNTFAMASGTSHVQVFEFDGSQWVQKGTSDDANPYGELSRQFPGAAESHLSHDGNVLALHKRWGQRGRGEVYRFEDGDWVQIGNFEGIQEDSQSAYLGNMRLSADGNIVAYTLRYTRWGRADELESEFHSRVKTFKLEDGEWVPFAEDIVVAEPNYYHDGFGHNLDISDDGKTLVVSATWAGKGDDEGDMGYFEVYQFENGVYTRRDRTERFGLKKFGDLVQISGDGSVIFVGSDHDLNHTPRHPSNEGVCSVYDGSVIVASESEAECPEPAPESVLLKVDGYRGEPSELLNMVAQVLFDAGHGDQVSLLGASVTLERD